MSPVILTLPVIQPCGGQRGHRHQGGLSQYLWGSNLVLNQFLKLSFTFQVKLGEEAQPTMCERSGQGGSGAPSPAPTAPHMDSLVGGLRTGPDAPMPLQGPSGGSPPSVLQQGQGRHWSCPRAVPPSTWGLQGPGGPGHRGDGQRKNLRGRWGLQAHPCPPNPEEGQAQGWGPWHMWLCGGSHWPAAPRPEGVEKPRPALPEGSRLQRAEGSPHGHQPSLPCLWHLPPPGISRRAKLFSN